MALDSGFRRNDERLGAMKRAPTRCSLCALWLNKHSERAGWRREGDADACGMRYYLA